MLPKLPGDQADDATPDDEQEVFHPQERLQLDQGERQKGREEEQAGEPGELPTSQNPTVHDVHGIKIYIQKCFIIEMGCTTSMRDNWTNKRITLFCLQ